MLEGKSICESNKNKRGKLPFAVFVSTDEYTTTQCGEEMETEYMQIFVSIIEERVQEKLRKKKPF